MLHVILGPTFTLTTAESPDALAERLDGWLRSGACPFEGRRQGRHLQLAVPRGTRHRWSPWLTIEVREPIPVPALPPVVVGEPGEPAAELFGRFNPSPAIWTGYMLASLALVTLMVGAGVWATAELVLQRPPWALWGIPACAAVLAGMWAVSAAGQRLAAEEMRAMREAVSQAAGE